MKTILLMFLISLIFVMQVSAQGVGEIKLAEQDSLPALQADKIKTHERLFLLVGQMVRYRLRSSKNFFKGRITGITDSAITFQNGRMENVTIMQKELIAFILPRSTGRSIFGSIALLTGSTSILIGLSIISNNKGKDANVGEAIATIFFFGGAAGIVNGAFLLKGKRINLQKSWTVRMTKVANKKGNRKAMKYKTMEGIVSGNIVTLVMKNGELIKKMKVTRITSENIFGVQSFLDSNGQLVQLKKTIAIKNIIELSRSIEK